jgi:hypothetical protein
VTDAVRRIERRPPWPWLGVLFLLLLVRLPSVVQPAGGDQGLYGYAGQRILASDVMYRDMWDQKPPGISFLYAGLWAIWPDESLVPAADLVAAGFVAAMLVAIGSRRFTPEVGYGAAAAFLLFGDPYLQRLSGVYVRGQCEPFISVSIAATLLLLTPPTRTAVRLMAAGAALGAAFWLKYNAAAFALPVAVAVWAWRADGARDARAVLRDLVWIGVGFAALAAIILGYFAAHGALHDLRLATIDYNLRYSNETYAGPWHSVRYVLTFPIRHARVDPLWFLGGLGAVLLAWRARGRHSTLVVLAWVAGAVLSIAINGSRGLPNYFVQAAPALALAASAGLATLAGTSTAVRLVVAAVLLAGAWRVGADEPVWGMRLAGLPGLVENVRYDLRHALGHSDRDSYLERFRGVKHDALENEKLVRYIEANTRTDEPIYIFGFSGGSVCWKSGRLSASRFYWSRPVFIDFAAEDPGYGAAGLLADLQQRPPALVALQKEEWRSEEHFMNDERLRNWLVASYALEYETPMFSVWLPRR